MTRTAVSALAVTHDPGYLIGGLLITFLVLVLLVSMVFGCARAAARSDRDSDRLVRLTAGGRR